MFVGLAITGLFAVVVRTTVAYTAALSAPEQRGRNLGVVTSGVVIGTLGARVASGALAEAWGGEASTSHSLCCCWRWRSSS